MRPSEGSGIVRAKRRPGVWSDAGALLHLVLALSNPALTTPQGAGQALLLGTSGNNGFAALALELS